MIDSHCHLADEAFAADRESVVSRARTAGLEGALCILAAGDADEAAAGAEAAALWPELRFAVGVHPHAAGQFGDDPARVTDLVRRALDENRAALAIGEIGLDYHYDFAPRPVQREVFRLQLRLALERALPVVIHTREAESDTLAIVGEEGGGRIPGVFHCFTGDERLARQVLDLGFHVSFSGIVTFPRADAIREAALIVPPERLLVETDSPYLAPVPFRGKRNEPARVRQVLEALAALRSVSFAELAGTTTRCFSTLFRA